MAFLFWLALITFCLLVATTIEFAVGNRSLHRLSKAPAIDTANAPSVSVVVAARNEARNIEAALQSLLRLDYPKIEFIVVNDRSTDETGQILDRIAATDPRLRVALLTELPKGWLGKNHALHVGAERAKGELLLFTDADVVMAAETLRHAVGYLQAAKLDHLAVAPRITVNGTLLNIFCGSFIVFFGLYAKPWKASDPKSTRHIGIGAFNLIRTEVYRSIGGHAPIAMRPDDDMKLGKLIKKSGYRQEMVLGDGMVTVEWYSSVRELVGGLEKNSFAGLEYSLVLLVISSIAQLAAFIWPVAAIFLTAGATRWLNAGCLAAIAVLYLDNNRRHGAKAGYVLGFPLAVLLLLFILWRATLKTLITDGISWRDTHYSLRELKANKL
jgi:glycosyltransferase involved in cell wall biosynthesis